MAALTLKKAEKTIRLFIGDRTHHGNCDSRVGKPCYARRTFAAHEALDFIMAAAKVAKPAKEGSP